MITERATVEVDASPEEVYALVSDVRRMGEWSPETFRCHWLGRVREARRGARFVGWNRYRALRWPTVCRIEVARPGRELCFVTDLGLRAMTRWRYRFEPRPPGREARRGVRRTDGTGLIRGTLLIEEREPLLPFQDLLERRLSPGHRASFTPAMQETLERIKAVAEHSARP